MLRWRRAASVVFAGALALGAAAPAWAARPPPTLRAAPEAVLYAPASGVFLYSRAPDREVPVASLTKRMTARLLLESGRLGQTATVPPGVTALPETKAGLVPGQQLPLTTLLQALLVRSANDAAYTVAVTLAGSEAAFAVQMNVEAARLHLTHTHYVNSSGLDAAGQYSSAADAAVLAASDMEWTVFRDDVDMASVAMPGGQVYRTVNPFLAYYAAADGVKTGFTPDAGFCLVASAVRSGQTLSAVVLGAPDWPTIDADAAALLNWGFGLLPPGSPGAAAAPPPAVPALPSRAVPAAPPPAAAAIAAPASGASAPASRASGTVRPATGGVRQVAESVGPVRARAPFGRSVWGRRRFWPVLAAAGIGALGLGWLALRRR